MNITFLSRRMSSDKLNLKLKNYAASIVRYLSEGDERSALRVARNINTLSNTEFLNTDFRVQWKSICDSMSSDIRKSLAVSSFFIKHMPIYNSPKISYFISSDYESNKLLVNKIKDDRFAFVRDDIDEDPARQLLFVFLRLMEIDDYDSALNILAFCIQSPKMRASYAYAEDTLATDIIFKPLIDAQGIQKVQNFVRDNEYALVFIAASSSYLSEIISQTQQSNQPLTNKEEQINRALKSPSLNHLSLDEIISSSGLGSQSLVKALLSSNKSGITHSSSTDCLVKLSKITGGLGNEMNEINHVTFYGKMNKPINDRPIVPYAYHFLNTEDDYLPKLLVIKKGMFNGLRSVFNHAEEHQKDRVHSLINKLKSMPMDENVMDELAKKIPSKYLFKHPDLSRLILQNDLGI